MKYMDTETMNPEKIMSNQTHMDKGDMKENKFTDFSGAFTYNKLIPRIIENC